MNSRTGRNRAVSRSPCSKPAWRGYSAVSVWWVYACPAVPLNDRSTEHLVWRVQTSLFAIEKRSISPAVDGVHALAGDDIAGMVLGEGLFQQDAHHQPVAAQTGVVLDHKGRRTARLHLCHHYRDRSCSRKSRRSTHPQRIWILEAVPIRFLLQRLHSNRWPGGWLAGSKVRRCGRSAVLQNG